MAKPSIYLVDDKVQFKAENQSNWYHNTDFWLEGRMRHLRDVSQFTSRELARLLQLYPKPNSLPTLFDFGCGDGWIYRLIRDAQFSASYVGMDFNDRFIDELRKRYGENENCKFYALDLEQAPPIDLLQAADVGVNFFNFFELADISAGFKNVAAMMRPGGRLLVVNIDPVMQILSISETHEKFLENLALYEKFGDRLGYDKDIDVGDEPSGRIYKSLFYSTATYTKLGAEVGFVLENYKEVVKTGNPVPQIYQFLYFRNAYHGLGDSQSNF